MVHENEGGQLMERIQELETRLDLLESILYRSGAGAHIELGDSVIFLDPSSVRIRAAEIVLEGKKVVILSDTDIDLESNNTSIKASNTVTLKGSKIVQN
jgi:hypothetical protein